MEMQKTIKDKEASKTTEILRYDKSLMNPRARIVVTFSSVLAYILFFAFLHYTYGQAMAISATIPVIVVGWLYGFVWGISTALLSLPANILMYKLFGVNWFEGILLSPGGISGTISLIFIGAIIGRIRDLSTQIKKHRDKLDELVKLKTEELRESNKKLEEEINEKKWANKKLKETKDSLDNIIESSLDCIMVSDRMGYIEKVNKYFLAMLGYSKEEVVGKFVAELTPISRCESYESVSEELVKIDDEYLNHTQNIIKILLDEGKASNWEAYYLRRDGKVVPVEQNIVCLYNNEGERTGAVAIIRDITERKKSENELRRTKDYLDNLIESSLDGIAVSDQIGYVTKVNPSFLKLIGFEEEEILGKHIAEFTPYEEGNYEATTGETVEIDERFINAQTKATETLFKEGKISGWESYYLSKDRKLVPVELNVAYLYNDEGEVIGSVGINRDITERRKAEKEIQEAKEFLEYVIKSSRDGILITDENANILSINTALEEMSGYKKEELMGEHPSIFAPDDEAMVEMIMEKTVEMYEKGFCFYESKLKTKGSKMVDVECNTSMIKDDKGNNVGAVSIIRNTTERKKMEQKLLQSEKLKSLGELSGGVAHDFNNVLAAILGRVQLLKMQIKAPLWKQEKRKSVLELKKGLEIIERASLDGAETIRRIQEFSRKGTNDKDFTQVDINALLDDALEFTRIRWKNETEAKGIEIRIQKELSPLYPVLGSSAELREVFTNLINNAIDAMPQGGEIRIKSFMNDSSAVIRIEDTGSGIPKNIKGRVFDPFFTTKGVQSTGLGLSVSYGIINRHHGTITVDSVEGEAAVFTIRFPITKKTGKAEVREEKVIPIKRRQKKARILLIEDEEDIRELLRDILTTAGHNVEVANDGSEGIEIFKKKKFDLVFTDLGMPVMSGWEVAEKVKSMNGKVPVVLITGWNVSLDSSEMNDSGINLVIHKPFKMEQVLNSVQEGMLLRDQLKAV